MKCSCKKLPVNIIDVDIHTRLLIIAKTCSKVRNGIFSTHRTVDTFNVVHTGGHTLAISEIHGVTSSTIFDRSSEFYIEISQEI